MRILKFGGSSVATPDTIKTVVGIIRNAHVAHRQVAVVVSALGGVTDILLKISDWALIDPMAYKEALKQLDDRHCSAIKALVSMKRQSAVLANVKHKLNQLDDVCRGVGLIRELTPKTIDFITSFGERLSAYILSEALQEYMPEVAYLDARKVVKTDALYGKAKVNFVKTNALITAYFEQNPQLQVITGFIGSTDDGSTTTLGRSGSDYTAAIFGAALDADAIEIWTDVDGMMTADPRKVKQAFSLTKMTYEEAMELSHFGAKVVFPATMLPAMKKRIPIIIKNTFNTVFEGTVISREPAVENIPVKGISSLSGICLLNLKGSNMVGVVGVSQRLFTALALAEVNIILISQASSEHSICLAVEAKDAQKARLAIEQTFEIEIARQYLSPLEVEVNLAIVAIVGENMRKVPGVSAKMFNALGKNGINVTAIAQGSSELNISAVIQENDLSKALNVLHEGLFLSHRKVINLFIAGTGLIGKQLLQMIERTKNNLDEQHHININIIGLANSRQMLLQKKEVEMDDYLQSLESQSEPTDLNKFLRYMKVVNLPNSVFVDATASNDIVQYYQPILESSISIVTPNKKANSGTFARYKQLREIVRRNNVRYLYETNVCAGLPVINVIKDLISSGDSVISLEAVVSGTLNYLLSEYDGSIPFSDLVKDAMKKGFTEPDPRDDLNGMDVARKILILARECGSELDLNDVALESIVPQKFLEAPTREQFLENLTAFDATFDATYQQAKASGKKLCYISRYSTEGLSVKLVEVGPEHPFYGLRGTENSVCITTNYYKTYPMVVKGPGAGAEVTAAGVFAEIIRMANQ